MESTWYDAHEPGRPTPPGFSYTVLFNFISPELAASFRSIVEEAPEELFETGRRKAAGYSRLNLLRYLSWLDDRRLFIDSARHKMAALIGAVPGYWYDCWLLRYLEGSGIRDHVDPVSPGDADTVTRYRLNVLLTPPAGSGELFVEGRKVELQQHDAALFSSGSLIHRVEPAAKSRLVLSIGMVAPLPTGDLP